MITLENVLELIELKAQDGCFELIDVSDLIEVEGETLIIKEKRYE